ncbi:MAG: hypothetical protein ACXWT0_01865 [Methylobacter sp.]
MPNSFFDNKTATSYKALIFAFDDDYYYGAFYRQYEGDFKQFLAPIYFDRDDVNFEEESKDFSLLYFNPNNNIDSQTLIDFEKEYMDELESAFGKIMYQHREAIAQALKKDGKTIEISLLE